jgi:hypothetical protein
MFGHTCSCLPEAERAIVDRKLQADDSPRRFRSRSNSLQDCALSRTRSMRPTSSFLPSGVAPINDQQALGHRPRGEPARRFRRARTVDPATPKPMEHPSIANQVLISAMNNKRFFRLNTSPWWLPLQGPELWVIERFTGATLSNGTAVQISSKASDSQGLRGCRAIRLHSLAGALIRRDSNGRNPPAGQ